MKKCPYCAEEIQDAAVKCKHCGEFLEGALRPPMDRRAMPWPLRTSTIVIAVCCVGPLALPLIWMRPRTSLAWKIALTLGVLALTWALWLAMQRALENLKAFYDLMGPL